MKDHEKFIKALKKQQADKKHKAMMRQATCIVDENYVPPSCRVPVTPPDAMTAEEFRKQWHPVCAALLYMLEHVCTTEEDRLEKLELAVDAGIAIRKVKHDGSIIYRIAVFSFKPKRKKHPTK